MRQWVITDVCQKVNLSLPHPTVPSSAVQPGGTQRFGQAGWRDGGATRPCVCQAPVGGDHTHVLGSGPPPGLAHRKAVFSVLEMAKMLGADILQNRLSLLALLGSTWFGLQVGDALASPSIGQKRGAVLGGGWEGGREGCSALLCRGTLAKHLAPHLPRGQHAARVLCLAHPTAVPAHPAGTRRVRSHGMLTGRKTSEGESLPL